MMKLSDPPCGTWMTICRRKNRRAGAFRRPPWRSLCLG